MAAEWNFKPTAFISYGAAGGGARSVENLRTALTTLYAFNLNEQVSIANFWTQIDENGAFQPTEEQNAGAHKLLKNIGFWSDVMKDARQKMPKA